MSNSNNKNANSSPLLALMAAASALVTPLASQDAIAQSGSFKIGYLNYREPNRMKVDEPFAGIDLALTDRWQLKANVVYDVMSGASPAGLTNRTGTTSTIYTAASIRDRRKAGDAKVTRLTDWGKIAASYAESNEDDYHSRAGAIEFGFDLNNKNTVLNLGLGRSNDRVGSTQLPDLNEKKRVRDYSIGVTQVLSETQIVSADIQRVQGRGFLSDPYKFTITIFPGRQFPFFYRDTRPEERNSTSLLVRYRHHLPGMDSTLRADYRYFTDSWGIRAHTIDVGFNLPVAAMWRVEPSVRYYSQTSADFYAYDAPVSGTGAQSSDARLGAFGSWTPQLKVIFSPDANNRFEALAGHMRQKSGYRLGGGTPAFEPTTATFGALTYTREF